MIDRRQLWFGATALVLATSSGVASATSPTAPTADDMTLGSRRARVTLIEYASASCPHCAHFHETVFPQLKTNYIDTGRVFFIFREMLTAPQAVALAGFQVARCNGADAQQYFSRLGEVFANQRAMYATGTMQGVLDTMVRVGADGGLTREQVMQCLQDPTGPDRVQRFEAGANQFNVTGTPTLVLNGQKLDDPSALTYEGLSHFIDQAIAAHR